MEKVKLGDIVEHQGEIYTIVHVGIKGFLIGIGNSGKARVTENILDLYSLKYLSLKIGDEIEGFFENEVDLKILKKLEDLK